MLSHPGSVPQSVLSATDSPAGTDTHIILASLRPGRRAKKTRKNDIDVQIVVPRSVIQQRSQHNAAWGSVTLITFTLRNALEVNLLLGPFKEIYLLKFQKNSIVFTIIKSFHLSGSVFSSVK